MDHKHLQASLTVEAAMVTGIVLVILGSLILVCFRLHDRAMAMNRLYLTVEQYSHRNPDSPDAEQYRKTAEDTQLYLMGGAAVRLEESTGLLPGMEGGLTGSISAGGKNASWEDHHLHGEDWLWGSTLADFKNLPEAKKKKTGKDETE